MLELFFFISLQSETRHGFKKASKKSARFTVGEKLESRAFVAKKSLVDGMLQKKKKEEKARIKMPTCASNQRNDRIRKKTTNKKTLFWAQHRRLRGCRGLGRLRQFCRRPCNQAPCLGLMAIFEAFAILGSAKLTRLRDRALHRACFELFFFFAFFLFFPPLALAGKPHVRPKKAVCGN